MHRKSYCCDAKSYENYYKGKAGGGMLFYSGAQYQRGHGLGCIFASIGRAVLPLVKSGAKAVGRKVLKSGTRIASDVLAGENVKRAAIRHAKQAGSNLLHRAVGGPPGEPFFQPISKRLKRKQKPVISRKARRKQSKDIFS